jgi:hypothetical protein
VAKLIGWSAAPELQSRRFEGPFILIRMVSSKIYEVFVRIFHHENFFPHLPLLRKLAKLTLFVIEGRSTIYMLYHALYCEVIKFLSKESKISDDV